jgi:GDPmannose 4,6-dehydratase
MKTALIFGISGQDGAYLADLLLGKGYAVAGTSRDVGAASFAGLDALGVRDRVSLHSVGLTDGPAVAGVVAAVAPDEVYHLAGQSSVGLSFERPAEAFTSIGLSTIHVLEAVRALARPARLFLASSGDCFGNTGDAPAVEETPFAPRSPYGVAKCAAHYSVDVYRQAYGLFACSGILFNHESPLRPKRFVTSKIIDAVCRIAAGSREPLRLGNIEVARDWGYAPEYVDAMWRMLQQENPEDFILATGTTITLREFTAAAFAAAGLDWREHVETDASLLRPSDIPVSRADPAKAARELGWRAKSKPADVAGILVEHELHQQANGK